MSQAIAQLESTGLNAKSVTKTLYDFAHSCLWVSPDVAYCQFAIRRWDLNARVLGWRRIWVVWCDC